MLCGESVGSSERARRGEIGRIDRCPVGVRSPASGSHRGETDLRPSAQSSVLRQADVTGPSLGDR